MSSHFVSLIELNLGNNILVDIPTILLIQSFQKLEELYLFEPLLSKQQIIDILTMILENNSLVELDLGDKNLNGVPTKLLTKAFTKLKKIDLFCSDMSFKQIVAGLEEI